jgi:hypothetical protein
MVSAIVRSSFQSLSSAGRALGIVPRVTAPEGYMDLDKDDYKDGDIFKTWQDIALATTRMLVVCIERPIGLCNFKLIAHL